jgi:Sjoegren syndrome nuclear autoantigen 1
MAAELTTNLVETLDKIKNKRSVLMTKMDEDQQLLSSVMAKIEIRTDRLSKITDRRLKRIAAKKEYEKTIMETEAAYKKILESSALLLKNLQEQAANDKDEQEMVNGMLGVSQEQTSVQPDASA